MSLLYFTVLFSVIKICLQLLRWLDGILESLYSHFVKKQTLYCLTDRTHITFYCWPRDTSGTSVSSTKTTPPPEDLPLSVTTADVREILLSLNIDMAASPRNMPGCVRKTCTNQLAEVITDILQHLTLTRGCSLLLPDSHQLSLFLKRLLCLILKGYSGVNLIHGLTHCKTVLDSLSRDQVSRPLIYRVLSTSETTTRKQYTAVNGSKYKLPPKKQKIMLRTAPNFSNRVQLETLNSVLFPVRSR